MFDFYGKTFQRKTLFVLFKVIAVTLLINLGFLIPLFDYYAGEIWQSLFWCCTSAGRRDKPAQLFLSSFRMISGGNTDGNWINGKLALTIGLPFTIMMIIFLVERGRQR